MNFKRVLVLVMALVMMVGACAPSVLAAVKAETNHTHHEESLVNPELLEKYEEIKAVVEAVAKDIEENHEEYYANGYAYALENGYIDGTIGAIKKALVLLPQIDLSGVEMSDEMRERLEVEIDALTPTLEKLVAILESGEAENFDGFVNAALTLEGDLYTHLNNIYAILEQANIEYLTPAFNYAMDVIENQVIPAIEETVNAYVDAVVDYVVDALAPYYNKAVEVIGIARDTYNSLVEIIVMIDLYVGGTIDAVVNAYTALVNTILSINATIEDINAAVENAINTACEIYNAVIDAIVELNAKVENTINRIEELIVEATAIYRYTLEVLVEVYGDVKNAITVAAQFYSYVVELLIENRPLIEAGIANAADLALEIYKGALVILKEAYEGGEDLYVAAARIGAYVSEVLARIDEEIKDANNGAITGEYELKDDSHYVAIGNAEYATALAGKLNLADKHTVVTFGGNYIEALAKADLVSAKFDNGSFVTLLETQIEGKLAEIINANDDLIAWYDGIDTLISSISSNQWIPDSYKTSIVNGLNETKSSIDGMIDLDAEVVELDWDKYLDAEGKAALNSLLAKVRAEVVAQGVPEYYYIDINPMINEVLVENGLDGIFTLSFEPIVVPQVDLVVFAVENMIYGYAEFVGNLTSVIENAPADATIILTPISNAFVGYSFKGIDLSGYAEAVDPVVSLLNAHLYAFAVANDNIVYVDSENADDIYNALDVYCDHITSGCTDTSCDRCLAKVNAPGHVFTNYVFNNDATCRKDGTETAKCDVCGFENKRTAVGTMTPHTWEPATCLTPMRCSVCKLKQGEVAPHVLGDWRVTKDPTSNSEGMRERKCTTKGCEYKITEAIPYDSLSKTATIAIIVAGVAVAGALSACVAGILRKKNKV